ncbi:MAG: hypothetical protein HUK02_04510 [Bacteroidaceae bacterium]|nr:hypothetical protein [Bacteroidaceae bacterium]
MIRKINYKDISLLKGYFGEGVMANSINWKLSSLCVNDDDKSVECIIVITNDNNIPQYLEDDEVDVLKISHLYNKDIVYDRLLRTFISIVYRTKFISVFWTEASIANDNICRYLKMVEYNNGDEHFFYHSTLNNYKFNK